MKFNAAAVLATLAASSFASFSFAQEEGDTGAPKILWTCHDMVADGGRILRIEESPTRQITAQLIQADQFVGDSIVATFSNVQVTKDAGFTPFEEFSATNAESKQSFKLLINILRDMGDGSLELDLANGVSETIPLICTQQ